MVFVIATDWKLRDAMISELRERGIDAVGVGTPEDVDSALATGDTPAAVVLEAIEEFAALPAIQRLVMRVPTILIASRTETVRLSPLAAVFYRPVSLGDMVAKVGELLARGRDV